MWIRENDIYLPVPELGEVHTHIECPYCGDEIIIRNADTHECRCCGREFKLHVKDC